MSEPTPDFNKYDFCKKLIIDKEELIVLKELSILACKKALGQLPDTPNKERDGKELQVQITKFEEDIEGAKKDIETVNELIQQYKDKEAGKNQDQPSSQLPATETIEGENMTPQPNEE